MMIHLKDIWAFEDKGGGEGSVVYFTNGLLFNALFTLRDPSV